MDLTRMATRLRERALAFPEAYEESPWGDRVVKVRGKIFFFCGVHEGRLGATVKLPQSGRALVSAGRAQPTGYGLGRSGWVTLRFIRAADVPEAELATWIDESYRAIAPKRLVAQLAAPAKAATVKAATAKSGAKATTKASAKAATAKSVKAESGATAKSTKAATAKSAATAAEPAAEPKRLRARVALVSRDPLRAARAATALAAHGVAATALAAAAVRARLARLDAVIVDVGRVAPEGLALAAEIDASDAPVHLFIAGLRDAAAHKRARAAATSAELFRAAPGDPEVVAAIVATLRRYA